MQGQALLLPHQQHRQLHVWWVSAHAMHQLALLWRLHTTLCFIQEWIIMGHPPGVTVMLTVALLLLAPEGVEMAYTHDTTAPGCRPPITSETG
jgi:hypothetical protein